MREECSGLAAKFETYAPCRHGFPMTGACFGTGGTPICCNERVCGRIYEQSGGKPPEHMIAAD